MTRKHWLIVCFVSFIHLLVFSHRMEVIPFLVDLKDLYGVGYTEVGGLVSSFLLGYAVLQIPAGTLSDRYSPKILIIVGLTTMLVTSILFVFTHSLFFALCLRFIMGASSAMIFSPVIKLISIFTPKEKRGVSIGILEGAAGLAMLITLTVFPFLSSFVEMNILFLFLSLSLFPVSLLFLKLSTKEGIDPTAINQKGIKKSDFLDLFKNKKIQRLMGISFFGLFGLYAFLAWMPTYMESALGYSKQKTGIIMAIMMTAQILAAPLSGKISDLMGQRKSAIIIGSILMAMSSLWLFFFHDQGIYLVVVLIGNGISLSLAPMLALATEIADVKIAGSVISIMNTIGQVGSAISGFIYGMLYDAFGNFQLIWIVCFIAFIIRICFCFGELENHREKYLNVRKKEIRAHS
ncbi:MFS transporter [Neobacillus drentensis]|uniref:MFS transporter n=1 Tax=Neobacillus drentensis TaxID=220684 RepID=UPI002FFFC6BB